MAWAYSLDTTGEGDQVGLLGASATELFHVNVDRESDDPIDVLQNRIAGDPYGRIGVPLKQAHPHPRLGKAVVVDYLKLQKSTPFSWQVLVIYATGDIVPGQGSFGGWRVAITIVSRSEQLARSIGRVDPRTGKTAPGSLIGSHHYKVILLSGAGVSSYYVISP